MKNFKVLAMAIIIAGLTLPASAQIDTSGITGWPQMYNSMASWEEGAFGANALGHPDYGWGVYNMISHGLTGDSIFVIKLSDDSYKRLWIVDRTATAVYTIRIADLDGSNEKEVEIDMRMYFAKRLEPNNLPITTCVGTPWSMSSLWQRTGT